MYKDRKFIHTRYGGCNVIALLNHDFELIEDNNIDVEGIGELPEVDDVSAYDGISIGANRAKINKLIQALKQHDREIKELKEK